MSTSNDSFPLRKITAVLCILTLLISLFLFFKSQPAAEVTQGKAVIAEYERNIAALNEKIPQYQAQVEALLKKMNNSEETFSSYEEACAAALSKVQGEYTAAKEDLAKVCPRTSYVRKQCSKECMNLHRAVTEAERALGEMQALVDQVAAPLTALRRTEEQLANATVEMPDMTRAYVILCCKIIAIVLAIVGLGLSAVVLFQDTHSSIPLLISCVAIAASSVLFLILSAIGSKTSFVLLLICSPHTYTVLAMAMFVSILRYTAKNAVVNRTIAIIALILAALLSTASVSMIACIPFAVTMVFFAFVVEPLVFTEYINIAKHIFLSLITFGIWSLVWIFHVTRNLNKVKNVTWRNARNELLLCLFLPFFCPYWFFKTGEYVEAYGREKEKSLNLEVLALIFSFICPLFATVLIQNKINVVASSLQEDSVTA